MKPVIKQTAIAIALACTTIVSGCSTLTNDSISQRNAELDARAKQLDAREAQLTNGATSSTSVQGTVGENDLLPPHAAPGECYARVWVEPQYESKTEEVLVAEEGKNITIIPAQYETVTETVEVSAASSRIETTPAVYGKETEEVLVSDVKRVWRIALDKNSAPASDVLLGVAKKYGIDLDAATPGMCFHEHYLDSTYKTVSDKVITKTATEAVTITPAQYETVEEQVLVKEASTRLVEVAAQYETVEEQVIDKPAHTIWKKGKGPIQRIDDATGEIMCLVEVPATYKTITRTVVTSPAGTQVVEIPAEYKTVKVTKLVSAAKEERTPIAEEYGSVERTVVDEEGHFEWHEVHDPHLPKTTRTGKQICLTEKPAQYKTVERTVVVTPAQSTTIEIPAEYEQVQVTKLVSAAREEATVIPAVYKTVEKQELVKDGFMAWRSILCETNMTTSRIGDIQRALQKAGYDIGPKGVDGVIGHETIQAMNAFQRDNNLPVDKYLNIETIKALGVTTK